MILQGKYFELSVPHLASDMQALLLSQAIQSTIFSITSASSAVNLVVSFPFAVWDYQQGGDEKIAKRAAAIEDMIKEKKT